MSFPLKILLFWLCLCGGLISGQVTAQQGFQFVDNVRSVRIPIEIFNNLILVKVRINDSPPANFIIDTGVRTTLMTEPLFLPFFKINALRSIPIRGLGAGEMIEAKLASKIKLSMPGVIGENMRMIVLPDGAVSYSGMFGKPVLGIIGFDLFKKFVVEINYHHKYMRLYDPAHFKPRKRMEAFPIKLRRAKPYLKLMVVDTHGDTLSTSWMIDTGASQALSIYHKDLDLPKNSLNAFIGRGLSGDMFGKVGRIKEVHIGKFSFPNVIAGFPDTASIRWVIQNRKQFTNLGSEILSRFTVVLDYNRRKMYLQKNPGYRRPFQYNTCGLETYAFGQYFDRIHISYVRPESPAEAAGIQIGDEIITINGFPVADLDLPEIHNRLNRKEGRKLCLRIRRKGEKMRKCFVMESGI